jgi:hypothetical protein
MARKSLLRYWGLDKEELNRSDVIEWMRKTKTNVYWRKDYGLVFRPRIGRETKKNIQQILRVRNKKDVERLHADLKRNASK